MDICLASVALLEVFWAIVLDCPDNDFKIY